jgi:hypothetical protein
MGTSAGPTNTFAHPPTYKRCDFARKHHSDRVRDKGRGASPVSSTARDQVDLERYCTCLISEFVVQVLSDVHDALAIKPVPDVHELQQRACQSSCVRYQSFLGADEAMQASQEV